MSSPDQQSKFTCTESQLEVNELNYAYKHWLIKNQADKNTTQQTYKVLALHGWLDNANSFDVLAPQLLEKLPLEIVALDLAGHGLSGHRHPQSHYNIWDDLSDIALITEQLGWDKFILMGHSRGGMISTLFASSLVKKLDALILLDGLLPIAIENEKAPEQLMRFVKQKIKAPSPRRTYALLEDAIAARCKAANMLEETARPIIDRALFKDDQGQLAWRSDPRLTHPSAFKLNREQNDAFFERIKVSTLLLLASQGLANYTEVCVSSIDTNPLIEHQIINASHHMHLEAQASQQIATAIESFLKTQLDI